jgi:hypothetical protein
MWLMLLTWRTEPWKVDKATNRCLLVDAIPETEIAKAHLVRHVICAMSARPSCSNSFIAHHRPQPISV